MKNFLLRILIFLEVNYETTRFKRKILKGHIPWRKQEQIIKQCLNCGKEFFTKHYLIKIGRGKFCSQSCAAQWRNKHNSKVGFKKGHKSYVKNRKGKTFEEIFGVSKTKKIKKEMAEKKLGHIPWNKNTKGIMKPNQTSFGKGHKSWNIGIKGKKSHSWINGNSFEPYAPEFFEKREMIRKLDNYTCQICGKIQKENRRKFDVHHIDSDKKNNFIKNLISLCDKCHQGTKSRKEYWEKKLRKITNLRS